MVSDVDQLQSQMAVVVSLLEKKVSETPSKFLALLLKRYRTDLNMLRTSSDRRTYHYGRFLIRGGYESLRVSEIARDEALEREIQRTETILHEWMTPKLGAH